MTLLQYVVKEALDSAVEGRYERALFGYAVAYRMCEDDVVGRSDELPVALACEEWVALRWAGVAEA